MSIVWVMNGYPAMGAQADYSALVKPGCVCREPNGHVLRESYRLAEVAKSYGLLK